MFDIKVALPLISAALSLCLGFLVLKRHKTKTTNITFFILALCVACWVFGVGMFHLSASPLWADFWARLLYFFGGSIATAFFYFSLIFPSPQIKISRSKKILILLPSIILIILYLFTDLIIAGSFVSEEQNRGFLYGQLRYLFEIHIWAFFVLAFIRFIKLYQGALAIVRQQIKYILLGVYISLSIASITNIILLWWGYFDLVWLGASASLIWISLITYAIVRYRLMDIRIAIRRTFLRLILAAFAYGTFYGALWFFNQSFGSAWVAPALITGIFIALIFAFLWPQIEKLALKFTNKFLYASIYTVQDTISNLTQQLTTIIDLDKIIALITDAMLQVMDVERVAVVIKETDKDSFQIKKLIGYQKKNFASITNNKNNLLLNWLTQRKQALVRGELTLKCQDTTSKAKRKKLTTIEKLMTDIKAELCLPLIFKNKLIGLIILDAKRSDDAYTAEDIKLLETLANQAAIAIENAKLYNQMEAIVASQTKDLRAKNIRLRKLLKMRGEFLNIASHQLRTPISIIKGNVSVLLEDLDKDVEPQKREIYQTISLKTEKLRKIIADILYASELDTGKFDLTGRDLENIKLIPYLRLLQEIKSPARFGLVNPNRRIYQSDGSGWKDY